MRKRVWVGCVGLLTTIELGSAAGAQTALPSTTAGDLTIAPRLGIGYTSSGGGFDGFTRFEGFVPLVQTPGRSLLFLEGRLLLDNSANVGGNVLLGYRTYDPVGDRVFGGYVGYDNRDTGRRTFSQLGFGIESLGTIDVRANAYIPIGDSRQLLTESVFDTGLQLSNTRFQGNFLVSEAQRQRQVTRLFEAALTGVDLEVGTRLARLGSGDLRGYGGLYYYSGGNAESLGWRVRLEARPIEGLNLGLVVQDDDLFGTNVIASVGLSLPLRSRSSVSSTLARLGESTLRTNSIVVDRQTEVNILNQSFLTLLSNPATGQPYLFQHVNLGIGSGDGTFERPFGTVQPALNATRSDGNSVVYVQAGTNLGIPAFTIPDRVQVLSTGSNQAIGTVEFGSVLLPLSGTGTLPLVTNTIALGSDSTLSGFTVTGLTGPGILARNIGNATLRTNQISSTNTAGILLENTSGTIALIDSPITATGVPSLVGSNVNTLTLVNSPLTSLNSTTVGLSLSGVTGSAILPVGTVRGSAGAGILLQNSTGSIAVSNFEIANSGDSGIIGRNLAAVTLQTNRIDSARNQGIYLLDSSNLTIADNRVTRTIQGTTTISNPISSNITIPLPPPFGSITIPNPGSTIPLPSGQGIVLGNTSGAVNVVRNTIADTATQGIVLLNAAGATTVADNSISNTVGANVTVPTALGPLSLPTGQGIVVSGINGTIDVARNQISTVNGQGIVLAGGNGTIGITSNTVNRSLSQGIALVGTSSTSTATIANNTVTDTIGQVITVPVPLFGNVAVPTGQGIALGNVAGTIAVTDNRVERTTGSTATSPIPPSGQGIYLLNVSNAVNLTIARNQVRQNFNDGVLLGLLGTATADVTITDNTIENNGNAIPPAIRGDGIAIGLEQTAAANVTIARNTIRGNGDEGIDMRVNLNTPGSAARLTGTVSDNTIANNGQNGVELQTLSTSPIAVNIDNNTINTPNAFQGIALQAAFANARLSANVRLNQLTNTPSNTGLFARTSPIGASTVCLNLSGNSSTTGYTLFQTTPAGTFQAVDLPNLPTNNTGTPVVLGGTISNVPACP